MRTLNIGVDLDDVAFPWYTKAHAACVKAGITNGVSPKTWSPHAEYGCGEQAWHDALEVATLDGSLYSGRPYPGAVAALNRLTDAGHHIHLVTARGFLIQGHMIRNQTVDWLKKYDVPHESLTFSKDKTIVVVDVFVEDAAKNVQKLVDAGTRTFMVSRAHNAKYIYSPRVKSLSEFADIILSEGVTP